MPAFEQALFGLSAVPKFYGRLPGDLPEAAGKVIAGGEAQLVGDFLNGAVRSFQQGFGPLDSGSLHIVADAKSRFLPEAPGEISHRMQVLETHLCPQYSSPCPKEGDGLKKALYKDFPGGPVVKTAFQCRGCGFDSWSVPHALQPKK